MTSSSRLTTVKSRVFSTLIFLFLSSVTPCTGNRPVQLPPEPCSIGCHCSRVAQQVDSETPSHLLRWHQLMSTYRQQHSVLRDNDDQTHHHDDAHDEEHHVTTGRVMTCNGLLDLPDYVPPDVSRLVIYGQRPLSNAPQWESPSDAGQSTLYNGLSADSPSIVAHQQVGPGAQHHQLTHLDRKFRAAVSRSAVEQLTIENNRIKILTDADLEGLYGLRWLRMPNNRLKMVRSHALDAVRNLERLDLSRNHIQSFGKATFDAAQRLRVLDLSFNRIRSLPPVVFRNLVGLEHLDLSGNRLESIDAKLFDNTTRLRKLSLDRNHLEVVPDGSLAALFHLSELSFIGNRLRSVPADAFNGYQDRFQRRTESQDVVEELTDQASSKDGLALERLLLDKNRLTTLTRRDVAAFPNLKVLSLSHNNITHIEDYSFVDVPHLERLILDHNAIEMLADQSFRSLDTLRELGLSHNELTALSAATLGGGYGLERLERLDLSHNRIDSIASGTFNGLRELRELRLDHNGIRWIDSDGLAIHKGLNAPFTAAADTKLTWLYLGHNQLDRLTRSMITGLRHLKFLDVAGNRINHLDVDAFQTTPRLTNLLMHGNRITELESRLFRGLSVLRHLNLAANRISVIDDTTFLGLDRVEDINLDDNELSSLPAPAFNHTPRLTTISARRNHVRIADLTIINFARRLRHLDLAQNLISMVTLPDSVAVTEASNKTSSAAVSRQHGGLISLSLVDNLLQSLDEKIISLIRVPAARTPHLGGTISLHGNPWACDCRMLWLVDAMSRGRVGGGARVASTMVLDRQSADDMLCKSPPYLGGRQLQSIKIEELQCR